MNTLNVVEAGQNTFDQIWSRICQSTGWKKQHELAAFLNIKPASVSGAKARGNFPVEWAFRVAQTYDLSTDWLVTGKYPPPIPQPMACESSNDYKNLSLAALFPQKDGGIKNLISFSMPDDSMEPTIRRGDILLLDRERNDPCHSGIYALESNGAILIKRVEFLLSGALMIKSDNPVYEPHTTSRDEIREVIFGEAVFHAREI